MKATPRLQALITAIAEKHKLDLDRPGAYLRLELEGHGQLVIENIGASRVSVTNFIQVNDDFMMDPRVVLYTDYVPENVASGETSKSQRRAWAPIESTEVLGGWLRAAYAAL